MIESSAPCEDRFFHALPSVEPSVPNIPKPRRASHEHFGPLSSWACQKFCLRLTAPAGLSRISFHVYDHSLPPPGPRTPTPSSFLRCPKANLVHSSALTHVGSGLESSCWTSMKTASSRPGPIPFYGLRRRSPKRLSRSKVEWCIQGIFPKRQPPIDASGAEPQLPQSEPSSHFV